MHSSSFVVPVQCDADVSFSVPFCCYCVVCFKCLLEVKYILFANILYSKIVHNKGELHWAPLVLPETWDKLALIIAALVESFFEDLVGEES